MKQIAERLTEGYFSKRFGIYLLRWLFSALVMLPVMMLLEAVLPLWGNLIVGQIFGALIFWNIDKWIFKHHEPDTLEAEMDKIGGIEK